MAASVIVSCLSQKGGVGKSTLARLIARTYAAAEWQVKIADLNVKQLTAVNWATRRMSLEVTPAIAAEPFAIVKKALQTDADVLVFDAKPDSDTTTLDAAKASDLIVIPTRPTMDDLQPNLVFAKELVIRGIDSRRILFVMNQTSDVSTLLTEEGKMWIDKNGPFKVADNDLPMKVGYNMAQNTGRAVSESPFPTLNARADALALEIIAHVDALTRKKAS